MKEKWENGWKVVRKGPGGRLKSAMMKKAYCNYKIGAVTERPDEGGPLAVFKDKRRARNFIELYSHLPLYLYPCKYIRSRSHSFWWPKHRRMEEAECPAGTNFADGVKILPIRKDNGTK